MPAIPDDQQDNFLGFEGSVDGRPVQPELEQRAFAAGIEVTDELKAQNVPFYPFGDAVIAASLSQAHAFWNFREMLPESQKPEGASIKHDISVPVAAMPAFIAQAAAAVERVCPGARPVCFGHMGDGNLHYNVSRPAGGDDAAFLALYRPMNQAVHEVVRSLDGSISAEHGIGRLKRDELIATAPPVAIDLMRRVKAAFDPAGIMNPGRVI